MVGALHIHGQQGEASTGPTHTCVGSRDVVDMQPFQVFVNITVFLLGLILVIKCSDSISISRAVGLVVVQSQSQSQSRPAPNLGDQSPTLTFALLLSATSQLAYGLYMFADSIRITRSCNWSDRTYDSCTSSLPGAIPNQTAVRANVVHSTTRLRTYNRG